MSNNNSTSPSDNSTTAESSTDSNSSGSSTDSTPITPTTDLGKAWMRYATYITEGEAREEGLGGEYDEYHVYAVEKAGTDASEYFSEATNLFQNFYKSYNASTEKNSELTAKILLNQQGLEFMTIYSRLTFSNESEIMDALYSGGPEALRSLAQSEFSQFTAINNTDIQEYGNAMIKYASTLADFYDMAVADGCALADGSMVTTSCTDVSTEYVEMAQTILSEKNTAQTLYTNIFTEYMQSLWDINMMLEDDE